MAAVGEVTEKESPEAEPATHEDPKEEPKAEPVGSEEPKADPEPEKAPAETEEEEVEEEEPDDGVPRVLVTGASGYIASVLTKTLLEDGRFRVRGTVRSKKKEKVFSNA